MMNDYLNLMIDARYNIGYKSIISFSLPRKFHFKYFVLGTFACK